MTQTAKLTCPNCGAEMNHHAMKVDYDVDDPGSIDPLFGGVLKEAYFCPNCGHTELKAASK
jgi:predicted RNA-binding Zn-ribbon protein involved in translation (DUF1610 family)